MPVAYAGTVTGRTGYTQGGSDKRSYMFVCYNGAAVTNARFFQKGAGATTGSETCLGLVGGSTNARFIRHNGSGVLTAGHQLTTLLPNGTRTSVVITHDQTSGALTAPVGYVNGVSSAITTFTPAAGSTQDNTAHFFIGNTDTGGNPMSSVAQEPLGEFILWDNAILTQMEVTALWNGVCPMLIRPAQLKVYVAEPSYSLTSAQLFRDYVVANGGVTYPNGNPNASITFVARVLTKVAQMAQVN